MVELFLAAFLQSPVAVKQPVPCVTARQVPTLATLHRPFRESGPVGRIFTYFVYDGPNSEVLLGHFRVAQLPQRIG